MVSSPIRIHPQNSELFEFRGRPLVLLTATEHYGAVINRNFDYLTYLDDMASKRQTLSRCFLLFHELSTFNSSSGNDNPLFGAPEAVRPVNPHSHCKPLAGEYVSPFARTGPGFATDGYSKFDLESVLGDAHQTLAEPVVLELVPIGEVI
jgi:hypothetical protein